MGVQPSLDFNDLARLSHLGFDGFISVSELRANPLTAPDETGIYLVLTPEDFSVHFVDVGSGGFFKGKDPNQNVDRLISNWVDGTRVIYIGQAGGGGSASTLRKRLRQYMRFGRGDCVGHWGGRFIWQLANADTLLVCWKPTADDPRDVERELISAFSDKFGRFPFANLKA